MLPRKNESDAAESSKSGASVTSALFSQWARLLGRALQPFIGMRSRLGRPGISVPDIRTIVSDGVGLLSAGRNSAGRSTTALVVLAVTAIGIGATVSVLLSAQGVLQAIVGALIGIGWVAIRLPIMHAIFSSADPERKTCLTESWVAGSIPYILAVNPPLRFIAWLLGAVLAYRVLLKGGADRRRVRSTIAIGFGFEAIGVLAVLATRYAMVLLELL